MLAQIAEAQKLRANLRPGNELMSARKKAALAAARFGVRERFLPSMVNGPHHILKTDDVFGLSAVSTATANLPKR